MQLRCNVVSIVQVVELAARRAGFHPDAAVDILFDPCCVMRTPITNMNRKPRYPSGQPLPAPDGDEAQECDDRGAFHIADLDRYSVQRDVRIAARHDADASERDADTDGDSDGDRSDDDEDGAADGAVNEGDDDRTEDSHGAILLVPPTLTPP